VVIGRHVFDEYGVFAGSDEARAADMQAALDDESVKAIFCSRSGYGFLRTWRSKTSPPAMRTSSRTSASPFRGNTKA
jgi:hypothetical protein